MSFQPECPQYTPQLGSRHEAPIWCQQCVKSILSSQISPHPTTQTLSASSGRFCTACVLGRNWRAARRHGRVQGCSENSPRHCLRRLDGHLAGRLYNGLLEQFWSSKSRILFSMCLGSLYSLFYLKTLYLFLLSVWVVCVCVCVCVCKAIGSNIELLFCKFSCFAYLFLTAVRWTQSQETIQSTNRQANKQMYLGC